MKSSLDNIPFQLKVSDLDEAIADYTRRQGFRLDMIMPADNPSEALLSKGDSLVRLIVARESSAAASDTSWHPGRAGMEYRDLIPGRANGKLIASHIRIPAGGPVADYVHYHMIDFQLLYCRSGWVRVAYQDQGEPIMMQAGDCVLQPPGIRHRVLECSAGVEVIEVGLPAIHETWADHELALPTSTLDPERVFGGQLFLHHQHQQARWEPSASAFVKDLGVGKASRGAGDAWVWRAESGSKFLMPSVAGPRLIFVLAGVLQIDLPDSTRELRSDDCILLPEKSQATIHCLSESEILDIGINPTLMAQSVTTLD